MPWYAIILVGAAGLLSLLCGLAVHQVDGEGGDRRILAGVAALGAALLLAIGKSIHLAGRLKGWW